MALTNYWWQIIWVLIFGVLSLVVSHKKPEMVCGKIEYRWNWAFVILMVLPLILWAGFRSNEYFDTWQYNLTYRDTPSLFENWMPYVLNARKDKGFVFLSVLLKTIFGNWHEGYFLIIAMIQMLFLSAVYRKYSCYFWLSIYLFVASTDYMSWMHNGMRQFLAVTIIFFATDYILKRKYISVILIILLAATIHGSALLMLPIVFAVQGKAWNRKTLWILAACIIGVLMVDRFTNILDVLLDNTQYENVITEWRESEDDGTNIIRVLLYSIPTIISLIGYRQIRRTDEPIIHLATNMSIASVGFWVISAFTSGIYFGRLPVYMHLYATGILLPWEIKHLFDKKSRFLVSMAVVVLYFIFFYYQMHLGFGIL